VITIMGSNMAENHPVGFQWVMEARERGARVFHIDPRFTRTSAMATDYIRIRAGTDIAFLGGVVNYILEHRREFRDYVVHYTNAPVIVDEGYRDTEDLDGLFSGWNPDEGSYEIDTWQYQGMQVHAASGQREQGTGKGESHGASGPPLEHGEPPAEDATLEDPRCVFQILKRHFSRYTPETVSRICGCSVEQFVDYAETLCANSGRERTGAFCYAVGWTQHTVGVQYIRAAAIVQQLLGNMGRPGGGIMALRGHASIQGSTDIPTLYNLLPGYLPMPHAEAYGDLHGYVEANCSPSGWWGHMEAYTVSLLRAWFGEAAQKENDWGFSWLPRIDKDDNVYRTTLEMLDGNVRGMIVVGENPAVGNANAKAHRLALAQLDWLVVRDCVEIETAAFWHDSPEIESGELRTDEIGTEVFFLPASAHTEKDGSFTNTQRLVQWHFKAVEPKDDCRSDLWFYYHLGRRIREALRESTDPRDRPIKHLTWDYPTLGEIEEPSAEAVLAEINGRNLVTGEYLSGYPQIKADGTTTCGCWIYCGLYKDGVNQTARRKPYWEHPYESALEWAWAWPDNRRILYNRASADPDGKPWSERKRYIWWDEQGGEWTGFDTPDFEPTKSPDYVPPDDAKAELAIAGDHPFVMQADGRSWLFVPQGLADGPLPTHYEPHESPYDNLLYGQRANPARQQFARRENSYNPSNGHAGADAYPHVVTTFRLTEHHCAGGFTRTVPYLAELQPAMFCEVGPELAAEAGLEHGGWATIYTARAAIEARVVVTDRIRSLEVDGRRVHQIGLPFHWGTRGLTTGGSANDLSSIVLDPNTHIQEVKAFSCGIRPGRRPRDGNLPRFVDELRDRAQADGRSAPDVEPGEVRQAT
jgi:formate dehydrogenase major subunit